MTGRPIFRPDPHLPARAMKTYGIAAPVQTHFRDASCDEASCSNYERGWKTHVDESTDLGQRQAHYIRSLSDRKYTEHKEPNGITMTTVFVFEAGQECFAQHRVRLDREELYVIRDGDHRGNPRRTDVHVCRDAEEWTDKFSSHQQKLADVIEKG